MNDVITLLIKYAAADLDAPGTLHGLSDDMLLELSDAFTIGHAGDAPALMKAQGWIDAEIESRDSIAKHLRGQHDQRSHSQRGGRLSQARGPDGRRVLVGASLPAGVKEIKARVNAELARTTDARTRSAAHLLAQDWIDMTWARIPELRSAIEHAQNRILATPHFSVSEPVDALAGILTIQGDRGRVDHAYLS